MFGIGRKMESCDVVYRISSERGIDEVDVQKLIGVMCSMSALVRESMKAAGHEGKLDTYVRPFERGSFIIELSFVYDQIVSLFAGQGADALANVLAFLGFGGTVSATLPKVIRKVRGRVDEGKKNPDGSVTFGGEGGVTVNAEQLAIVMSPEVAKQFKMAVAEPLKGIRDAERVTIQVKGEDGIASGDSFTEADVAAIGTYEQVVVDGTPEECEEMVSTMHSIPISPVSGPYDGAERGYTFRYDEETWRGVHIDAEDFRQRLEEGLVRFHEKDLLEVDLEVVQVKDDNGRFKVAGRRIVKVVDYVPYTPLDQATIDEAIGEPPE